MEENETENVLYINILIDIPCIVMTADNQGTSQTGIPTYTWGPLWRSPIYHSITYGTPITVAESESNCHFSLKKYKDLSDEHYGGFEWIFN